MFYNGMRARVQLDDEDFSAWVLSPLLFAIFYAAVIIVVLHQFVEDPLVVSDLVYLASMLRQGMRMVGHGRR